ncbi:MAG: cell envelope biogenesis protein OmpA [Rhodobacterales bacterium]|nr:MAG: cell envelope biogenesis protein OmpA [Rhodobacterales bacterium]
MTDAGEVTLRYDHTECEGALCPDPEDYVPRLRLSGAARMSDVLMPALIEGYARTRGLRAVRREVDPLHFEYDVEDASSGLPVLRFSFHVGTSDEGFADLFSNQADAALSVREIRPEEARQGSEAGLGRLSDARRSEIVALDALVPVGSPRRLLRPLTPTELAGLFAGTITDWAQLGLAPGPVKLHLGPEQSGDVQGFIDGVLTPAGVTLSDTVQFHDTTDAMTTAVAQDAGAVGVAPYRNHGLARPLPLGGSCGMVSDANLLSLKTEDYTLTRPLFIYLPERRMAPEASAWLAWLRSSEAQKIVRRAGFVDRGPVPVPLSRQGDRLARAILVAGEEISLANLQDMVGKLSRRQRLSTTFRFTPGSTRLDAQSRSNMLQLGRAIRDGEYQGARLFLVGFSDGVGPAEANRSLSLARAESVRRQLLNVLSDGLPDGVSLEIDAFGEALPLACDDSDWGRQTNRRVELWVAQGALQ